MNLLIGVLVVLQVIAVIYIAVERLTSWLTKHGGFTIRIEVEEGIDDMLILLLI